MKWKFIIEIDVDTDTPTDTFTSIFGERTSMQPAYDGKNFKIRLRRDMWDFTSAPQTEVLALAHELGHVIGWVFGTPRSHLDPRNGGGFSGYFGTHGDRIVNSEEEAWDFGEIMLHAAQLRQECMKAYKRNNAVDYSIQPAPESYINLEIK